MLPGTHEHEKQPFQTAGIGIKLQTNDICKKNKEIHHHTLFCRLSVAPSQLPPGPQAILRFPGKKRGHNSLDAKCGKSCRGSSGASGSRSHPGSERAGSKRAAFPKESGARRFIFERSFPDFSSCLHILRYGNFSGKNCLN